MARKRKKKWRNKRKTGGCSAKVAEIYGARNDLLWKLGFVDYKQYLRSKIWKNIRARQLEAEPNCYACGKPANQVHHGEYTEANLTGATLDGLYSVTAGCHKKAEMTRDGFKRSPYEATAELRRMKKYYLSRKKVPRGATRYVTVVVRNLSNQGS